MCMSLRNCGIIGEIPSFDGTKSLEALQINLNHMLMEKDPRGLQGGCRGLEGQFI